MTRIIRAEQCARVVPTLIVEAQDQARAILSDARSRAEALCSAAEARCEAITARAEHEGRERGRNEARVELEAALERLVEAREQWLAALPPQLIELAMAAASHVVGAELALRPQAIETIVQPLLERLRRAQRIQLRLHPDDERWLRTTLPGLQRALSDRAVVELHPDPEIARGGCWVLSDIGAIDARLEARVERLEDALKQTARRDGE